MAKLNRTPTVAHNAQRAGEGAMVDVLHHTLMLPDGKTSVVMEISLSKAPVPERRYVADVAAILYERETVKLLFGQKKISSPDLRSLLVIHMSPMAARRLVESVTKLDASILKLAQGIKLGAEPLDKISNEPEQTVAFVSNMVAVALSGREACMDFYHVSSFSMANAANSKKMGLEPVVRLDIRSTMLIALIEELKRIESNFPPEDTERLE